MKKKKKTNIVNVISHLLTKMPTKTVKNVKCETAGG